MGCWSENCALSGLEILCYPCRVSVLDESGKHLFPYMLGEYDSYGRVDLLEDYPEFGLKNGDSFSPIEYGKPIYIDEEVFQFVGSLEPEFSMSGEKTINKDTDNIFDEYQEAKMSLKIANTLLSQNIPDDLRETIEFRKLGIPFMDDYVSGPPSKWTNLDHCKNVFKLYRSFGELRKSFNGRFNTPQHGGLQALIPFYEKILEIAKNRKSQDEEEA